MMKFITIHVQRQRSLVFKDSAILGAGRSSEVKRSLVVRWVVGSILQGVDPLS